MMKLALTALLLAAELCGMTAAHAANRYVRAGATGAANGSDWANAYPALPSTLVRGDTYFIADGNYGSYKFNTAQSGTTKITIKKATAADHGTDAGWNAAYGDGEALFTGSAPVWTFATGNYTIDGVVGQGKAATPYGIRVMPSSTRCVNEFNSAVLFQSGTQITNLLMRHVDFGWNNGSASCGSAVPALLYTSGASSDSVTIENSYFHHAPGYALYVGGYDPNPGGLVQNQWKIRNNYFYMLGGGGSDDHHWELMWLMNVDNSDIANNVVEDVVGSAGQTGWVMIAKANNLNVYGNLFYCTDAACIVGGNGVVATWSADAYKNDSVRIYNNTFAKLRGVFNDFGIRFTHNSVADTNIIVKNNLYCNARFSWSGVTSQSNEACGCGQVCKGTNPQTNISTASFANYSAANFRLNAATSAADTSIGTQFGIDMDGRTRGADGVWDRGAFEYGITLGAPSNLRAQ